jgi:hypothetical protein
MRKHPASEKNTRLTIMRKTNKISRASSSAVEQGTLNPLVVGSNPSWLTENR